MAFDVILSGGGKDTAVFHLSESLHSALFDPLASGNQRRLLRRIQDYYLTDCTFTGADIASFADALASARDRADPADQPALDGLLKALASHDWTSVYCTGD